MLHYLWVSDTDTVWHERLRAQVALILIIAGATSTRPDALIGHVRYEHVEFQVFRPLEGSSHARIGLIVNLEHVKAKAGGRMIFGFHEEANLLHDPVAHMLGIALADQAFVNGITNLGQLYAMRVPEKQDRIRLTWQQEWLDRPIFRATEIGRYGRTVSLTKPLPYDYVRKSLRSLGRAVGFAKPLEFYDIRRGSGRRLNGK